MVRYIPQLAFDEADYAFIIQEKEKHKGNWHDFILDIVRFYKEIKENEKSKK